MAVKNQRISPQRLERIQQLLIDAAEDKLAGKKNLVEQKCKKALQLDPKSLSAIQMLTTHLIDENDLEQAQRYLKIGLTVNPKCSALHKDQGRIHEQQGQNDPALVCYRMAIKYDESCQEAYKHLGLALTKDKQHEAATAILETYVHNHPDCTEGHLYLGKVLLNCGKTSSALINFQKAVELSPDNLEAQVALHLAYRKLCDWQSHAAHLETLLLIIEQHLKSTGPIDISLNDVLSTIDNPKIHNAINEKQMQWHMKRTKHKRQQYEFPVSMRLRIAYIINPKQTESPEWIGDILAQHNKDKFDVYIYSLCKSNQHKLRKQCDVLIDISSDSHKETAKKIKGRKIQIIVDLSDYTQHHFNEVLFYNPAPIQCHAFSYPNLLDVNCFDYQLIHKDILPDQYYKKFQQKIACLPRTDFVCTGLPETLPELSKADYELPFDKTIFCYLDDPQWIDEACFSAWMLILRQVPNSVLWLATEDPCLRNHLCQFAKAKGVAADRLLFSSPEALDVNWPQQLADIWLSPFNTLNKKSIIYAAWCGLPCITYQGDTISSRTASCYASAANMEDLIGTNAKEYVNNAVSLASNTLRLGLRRNQQLTGRDELALFNVKNYIIRLEKIYTQMWHQYQLGDPPNAKKIK